MKLKKKNHQCEEAFCPAPCINHLLHREWAEPSCSLRKCRPGKKESTVTSRVRCSWTDYTVWNHLSLFCKPRWIFSGLQNMFYYKSNTLGWRNDLATKSISFPHIEPEFEFWYSQLPIIIAPGALVPSSRHLEYCTQEAHVHMYIYINMHTHI